MASGVSGFETFLSFLTGVDAFSLLFPFILAWLLYYVALEQINTFDDSSLDNFIPVMSLILAFFTARFLVANPFYQSFFADFFGKLVIGLGSLLGLYTIMSFTGFDVNGNDTANNIVKWIAASMAGAAFIWAGGFGPAIFGADEIGGGIGTGISAFSSLLFESGLIWLIVIGLPLGYIMINDRNGGNGNQNNNNNNNTT